MVDHQHLTCPQLLSEDVLQMILKDRCIDVPDLQSMDKPKLIEIFKRVALPMSQRKYHVEGPLGKRLHGLRLSKSITIANFDENIELSTAATESLDTDHNKSEDNVIINGRLKPAINDLKPLQKRIRLSSTGKSEAIEQQHEMKRKCEKEALSQSQSNKRQKITWP